MRGSIKGRHRKRFISLYPFRNFIAAGQIQPAAGLTFREEPNLSLRPLKSRSQPNRKHTHTRYEPSLARMLHARGYGIEWVRPHALHPHCAGQRRIAGAFSYPHSSSSSALASL
jgi:hypothetical protein